MRPAWDVRGRETLTDLSGRRRFRRRPPLRRFVFVGVPVKGGPASIARCDEGTNGYTLLPMIIERFESFEAAQDRAMKWNRTMGYTDEEAELIAVGTMRQWNMEDRIKHLTELLKRGRELLVEAGGEYKALSLEQREWADEIERLDE